MTTLRERFGSARELAEWLLENREENMMDVFGYTDEYMNALYEFTLEYAKCALDGSLEMVYGDTVDDILGELEE